MISFKWLGGDHLGKLTIQNVYTEITHMLWHTNIKGWRKQLWTWHLPSKIKFFTWLMTAYKLNTWDILQRKGWMGPNIFHLCYNDDESADHLFIKCPFSRKVWEKITLVLDLKSTWDGPTLSDCFDFGPIGNTNLSICHPWSVGPFGWTEIFFFFENETPSTSSATYKTLGLFKNWNDIHPCKPRLQNTKRTLDLEDTPTGWFDGATLSNGTQSGVGGLIIITKNSSYRWNFNCGLGTNTRVELLGAWPLYTWPPDFILKHFRYLGTP
jgi:hypothetical protein